MKKKHSFAFTLAELLMATLVMSIILTALAPVMTKRTLDNVNIGNRTEMDGKLFLYNPYAEGATRDGNTVKYTFTVPEGVYEIDAVIVGGGGGGGGGGLTNVDEEKLIAGNNEDCTTSQRAELEVVPGMRDFKIDWLIGAGGGGGGGYAGSTSGPDSQEMCDEILSGTIFVPNVDNGNACLTKTGLRSDAKSVIPTYAKNSVVSDIVDKKVGGTLSDRHCFKNVTHAASSDAASIVVCPYSIASNVCNNIEVNFSNVSVKKDLFLVATSTEIHHAGTGLMCAPSGLSNLCVPDTSYCTTVGGSTTGTGCNVNYLWVSGGEAIKYSGRNGIMTVEAIHQMSSADFRCALNSHGGAVSTMRANGGGGGGAGSVIRDIPLQYNEGRRIVITTGASGTGGDGGSGNTAAKEGGRGGHSKVVFYTSGPERLEYTAMGAWGGKGAGKIKAADNFTGDEHTCQRSYYYGTRDGWRSTDTLVSCYDTDGLGEAHGSYGRVGDSKGGLVLKYLNASDNAYFSSYGGYGGKAMYGYIYGTNQGSPYSATAGDSGCKYTKYWGAGGGGGGASANYTKSNNQTTATSYRGGYGGAGYGQVSYKFNRRAYAGAGGGGGAMIKLSNVSVTPGQTLEIYVGGGGEGGSAGSGGSAGGASRITFEENKYALVTASYGGFPGGSTTTEDNSIDYNSISNQYGPTPLRNGGSTVIRGIQNYRIYSGTTGGMPTNEGWSTGVRSFGGQGGKSGAGIKGGCGGLLTNTDCTNSSENGVSPNFRAPSLIYKTIDYGSAGAGGGGGGIRNNLEALEQSGTGGDGQAGYVFILWEKPGV